MSTRLLLLLIGLATVALIGVALFSLILVVRKFPVTVLIALLIAVVTRVVISRERAKESRFEWQFIHEKGRWSWEQRENSKVVRRSIGSFQTKKHCLDSAREHGYSSFFCRCREITYVPGQQSSDPPVARG
jgi:hypothetical protein